MGYFDQKTDLGREKTVRAFCARGPIALMSRIEQENSFSDTYGYLRQYLGEFDDEFLDELVAEAAKCRYDIYDPDDVVKEYTINGAARNGLSGVDLERRKATLLTIFPTEVFKEQVRNMGKAETYAIYYYLNLGFMAVLCAPPDLAVLAAQEKDA